MYDYGFMLGGTMNAVWFTWFVPMLYVSCIIYAFIDGHFEKKKAVREAARLHGVWQKAEGDFAEMSAINLAANQPRRVREKMQQVVRH